MIFLIKLKTKISKFYNKIYKWILGIICGLGIGLYILSIIYSERIYIKTLDMKWGMIHTLLSKGFGYIIVIILSGFLLYYLKDFRRKLVVLIILGLIVIFLTINPTNLKYYKINNKQMFFIQTLINQYKDISEAKYEIISCKDCEVLANIILIDKDAEGIRYCYLSINNGSYILPIPSDKSEYFLRLINTEKGIYEIKVYSNTKFIVEVNGIALNELDTNTVENYQIMLQASKCTLTVNNDNQIKIIVNDEGSEWEEWHFNVLRPDKTRAFSIGIEKDDTCSLDFERCKDQEGTWCLYISDYRHKIMSNLILYDVVNKEITNIRTKYPTSKTMDIEH